MLNYALEFFENKGQNHANLAGIVKDVCLEPSGRDCMAFLVFFVKLSAFLEQFLCLLFDFLGVRDSPERIPAPIEEFHNFLDFFEVKIFEN